MDNKAKWDDQRVEEIISYLLRAGVLLAATLVLAGGIVYLIRHSGDVPDYHTFRGEPVELRTVRGLFSLDSFRHGRGLIHLGLVLLILTPIARVAFSVAAFVGERDWMYTAISAIVLVLLLYGFTAG